MDTKTRPIYMLKQETHFRPQDTYTLKVRGWKNIFHPNGKQNKAGVAIFIDKTDLKIKKITSADSRDGTQEQRRGATPCPRSEAEPRRSYPMSKVRSSGCALLEQPWRDTPHPR